MSNPVFSTKGTLNDEIQSVQTLPCQAYEISFAMKHRSNEDRSGQLVGCVVSPITIIRHGVRPGSVLATITATSEDGSEFTGYACDFYATREDAQRVANASLQRAGVASATAVAA